METVKKSSKRNYIFNVIWYLWIKFRVLSKKVKKSKKKCQNDKKDFLLMQEVKIDVHNSLYSLVRKI